ncbi:MAG TPA: ATP-binding protein [Spirochaetota bacterium]|nr:ATP-binding protein [Spirochaetota bacterium]
MKDLLRNVKIRQKLLIVFQFMSIPTIIIFIASLIMMNYLQEAQNKILVENVSSIIAAYNVENSILGLKGLKANYFLDGKRKWLDEFEVNKKNFNHWYNEAFNSANTEEEKNILSAMAADFAVYQQYHDRIIELVRQKKNHEAVRLLLNDSNKYYTSIFIGCEKLINKNEQLINEAKKSMASYLNISRILVLIAIVSFIFLGVMLVLMVARSIVDPIKEIEEASNEYVAHPESKSEIENLKKRFELMIETINNNQKQLVQSERKAAIGEIAAGISHELNNPIGIILGFSEILIKRKELSTDNSELIKDIHSEATRCKKLLGEMLDFARIADPKYETVNIKDLIKKTVHLFASQEKYSNVAFEIDVPRQSIKIPADSMQLKQVLINIIINACDALNNIGVISLNLILEEDTVVLKIKDNGPGVTEENREKIFNPFFTTKPKGVGLGLAICSDLMRKHNGSLALSQGVEGGAEFILRLPRRIHESR